MEFIGDRITVAAYVVRPEGATTQCGDAGFQSDWSLTYSALLCHRFNAACSTIAVGGKVRGDARAAAAAHAATAAARRAAAVRRVAADVPPFQCMMKESGCGGLQVPDFFLSALSDGLAPPGQVRDDAAAARAAAARAAAAPANSLSPRSARPPPAALQHRRRRDCLRPAREGKLLPALRLPAGGGEG